MLFSVVIPVYNRRQWVGRAIRSVLQQTCRDWEVLVVDDASEDDTAAFVQSEFGDAVHLIKLPHNGGVSAARNRGI